MNRVCEQMSQSELRALLKSQEQLLSPHSLEAYGLGALESIMQVNNQRKVFVPVVNYHQRDVYMDEETVLGSVEVYPDGVSDLTQSLELAVCNSSMESGTLEAGVAVVSADGVSQSEALLEAVQYGQET